MKGRADYLALGDWNAVCYECGFEFKASELVRHWQGFYVCKSCWESRHPQDFVRAVVDNQTPPWTQPRPTDSFGTARLASNSGGSGGAGGASGSGTWGAGSSGATSTNSGIVPATLYIAEIPWTPGGSTITDFVLTDYITPPSSWPSTGGKPFSDEGASAGGGGVDTGTGWGTVLINIPDGVTIDGSFDFGDGWPAADADGNGGTEFIVNNSGNVTVIPDFLDETNITVNGDPFGEPNDNPDYTLDWRLGQFPPPVLTFDVQPADVAVDTSISPAVEVWVVGNLSVAISNVVFKVQLTIGTNGGDPAGTLVGGSAVSTVAGVATFSGLQIDEAGEGYTLVAEVV